MTCKPVLCRIVLVHAGVYDNIAEFRYHKMFPVEHTFWTHCFISWWWRKAAARPVQVGVAAVGPEWCGKRESQRLLSQAEREVDKGRYQEHCMYPYPYSICVPYRHHFRPWILCLLNWHNQGSPMAEVKTFPIVSEQKVSYPEETFPTSPSHGWNVCVSWGFSTIGAQ